MSESKTPKTLTLKIDGVTYNATDFASMHPGGNIIEKYDTTIVADASDAFHNFHTGSKRALALLKTIPKIGSEPFERTEFQSMLQSWKNRGLYDGGHSQFVLWGASTASIVWLGVHTLGQGYPIWGGLIAGFAWGQCGFIQHHAGHLAFTGNPRIDFMVQSVFESLLKGGSGRWWRNRHNKHHAMPNSVEHDGDLRTTPFFAWDDVLIKKVPTCFLPIQHLMFLPLLALYVPILATSVFSFVIRRKYWDELGLMVLHFVFVLQYCSNIQSLLIFYFIGYAIQGIYLGCMFGMSHYTMPRVETTDAKDWAAWQLTTTCNWGVGSRFAEYISGFLNLQIEHHIATRMPPENYHLICDDLRKYAAEHSLPYVELSFWEAFTNMFRGLHETGRREYKRRKEKKTT